MRRLLIRPGAIGDLIVSLPALEHLRADYTEVWVAETNVPLVRFADRVRSIQSTGLNLLELGHAPGSLMEELRSFESIVSWYGTGRDEFRRAANGLPIWFLPALPPGANTHATDYYLRQVGAPAGATPRIACPAEKSGFAVIHPFSGSMRKNWPLEKFRALAGCLRLPVRWCAGPEEELQEAIRFDDLYQLACWLAGARLYIGNDSGITHLAAAGGAPVLALFGPTDPEVWGPRGSSIHILRKQPLAELTVEAVVHCIQCEFGL